jgi:hypothetical protein
VVRNQRRQSRNDWAIWDTFDDMTGVFTLSLDTELAWGSFDRGGVDRYGAAYRRTPDAVDHLCDLLDRFEVPATWAFVGHLLERCDREHAAETARLREWLARAPCTNGVDESLWYAPALLDRVRS